MEQDFTERYSRQLMLPEIGPGGQRRLAQSSALIIGLGGLGSPVATYLAAAGVGRLGLCDADTVSLSNLQRQVLYTAAEVGCPKAEAARRRLTAMVPGLAADLWPVMIDSGNAAEIIGGYDLVVDCCDNFATRYLIDDTCAALGKPWVYGTIGAFHGQAALMNGRAGIRYRHLYPDSDGLCARPRTVAGVLGAVPGIIGTVQAAEALKYLGGFGHNLDGRLLTLDVLDMDINILEFNNHD